MKSGEQTAGTGVWTDWKRNVMGELPITGTVSVALNTFTNYLEAFAIIGFIFFSFLFHFFFFFSFSFFYFHRRRWLYASSLATR